MNLTRESRFLVIIENNADTMEMDNRKLCLGRLDLHLPSAELFGRNACMRDRRLFARLLGAQRGSLAKRTVIMTSSLSVRTIGLVALAAVLAAPVAPAFAEWHHGGGGGYRGGHDWGHGGYRGGGGGWGGAGGVALGFGLGAVVGGALAAPPPVYYAPPPAYYAPPPAVYYGY
jgi:hypothetical protein